jgi:hypothetical protein
MYKKNKYEIDIEYNGYVRTKNNLSGNIKFSKTIKIQANSEAEAYIIALSISESSSFKIKDNYDNSSFNMDFDKDEIIRDDTERIISKPYRKFYSYRNYIKDFNESFYFMLLINKKDLKEIRKNLFKNKEYQISEEDIWNFLDNKYFLPKKIRFDVKELDLKKIKPETYFKKNINYFPTLSYYSNEINFLSNTNLLLNSIINNEPLLLEEKEIENKISNRKIKQLEKKSLNNKKNKFKKILQESKIDFINILKNKLKDVDLEEFVDKFHLSIVEK